MKHNLILSVLWFIGSIALGVAILWTEYWYLAFILIGFGLLKAQQHYLKYYTESQKELIERLKKETEKLIELEAFFKKTLASEQITVKAELENKERVNAGESIATQKNMKMITDTENVEDSGIVWGLRIELSGDLNDFIENKIIQVKNLVGRYNQSPIYEWIIFRDKHYKYVGLVPTILANDVPTLIVGDLLYESRA